MVCILKHGVIRECNSGSDVQVLCAARSTTELAYSAHKR